ncbi:MAG: Zinc-binding alcohol dehydrogenase [Betaproteobacteria bacterium]|nr:Zinc-binding alcohol dehydrogenase [Betaproteobacteria bacterium]
MKSCWIVVKDHKAALEWREVPVPAPKANEIVIRVRASALNRGELVVGGAVHGGPEKIGGTEAAGEVHAIGAGVTGVKTGDRVFGRVRGGFAEYVAMETAQIIPLPPKLTFEQGAAVPISYITAYEMLYAPYGNLKAGEWLLITGASAGAGVASIQIAKLLGAKTIGTSGSGDKLAKLKALGLDVAIETRGANFADKVKAATGGTGADLIVNLVGGTQFAECVRSAARHGRIAVVGYVDGSVSAEIDLSAVHVNRLEIFGISNAKLTAEEKADATRRFVRDVVPAIADGRIVPVVDRVFEFADMAAAKAHMEASAMVGKIVVRMP